MARRIIHTAARQAIMDDIRGGVKLSAIAEKHGVSIGFVSKVKAAIRSTLPVQEKTAPVSKKRNRLQDEKAKRDLVEQEKPKKREARRQNPCRGCYMVLDAGGGVGTVPCVYHCLRGKK